MSPRRIAIDLAALFALAGFLFFVIQLGAVLAPERIIS